MLMNPAIPTTDTTKSTQSAGLICRDSALDISALTLSRSTRVKDAIFSESLSFSTPSIALAITLTMNDATNEYTPHHNWLTNTDVFALEPMVPVSKFTPPPARTPAKKYKNEP